MRFIGKMWITLGACPDLLMSLDDKHLLLLAWTYGAQNHCSTGDSNSFELNTDLKKVFMIALPRE